MTEHFIEKREGARDKIEWVRSEDLVSKGPIWKPARLPRSHEDKRFPCQVARKTKETT